MGTSLLITDPPTGLDSFDGVQSGSVDLSVGEDLTFVGDLFIQDNGPPFTGDSGTYSFAETGPGSFTATNTTDGTFTFSMTYADWISAGAPGTITLNFGSDYDGGQVNNFAISVTCFLAGTMIATPEGARAVESLAIDDMVSTADGRAVPVKWLGRQTLSKYSHGLHMQPVRISAEALGDGLPHSDLKVTADHGMIIDGFVINASALVNHQNIDYVPFAELEDRFTVFHIETPNHDVILANGAASETFIDLAGRAAFDNYQEYIDLYGAERIIPEMQMPRISSTRLLPTPIKSKILGTNPPARQDQAYISARRVL